MQLETVLDEAVERNASDIHLVVGEPPVFRVNGALVRQEENTTVLDPATMDRLLLPLLTDSLRALLTEGNLSFADVVLAQGRNLFGVAIYRERGRLAATIRVAMPEVPSLEAIGGDMTPLLTALSEKPRGLILFTGPTGSGKATTAIALIEHINRTRSERIYTVEESPSYAFESKQSLITSLFVGQDTESYERAAHVLLTGADPDVVYLNDLPTAEAVRQALMLAETGHLVIANLHAESAVSAVEQMVTAFPEPRAPVRSLLARTLVAVFSQRLLPRRDRPGRVAAYEVLLGTARVREIIRGSGPLDNLTDAIQADSGEGMRTAQSAIAALVAAGEISEETAEAYRDDPMRSATHNTPSPLSQPPQNE